MYIERQISYLHSQVSLDVYELHKTGMRSSFRWGTVSMHKPYSTQSAVLYVMIASNES